jgi:hypothetical protein
MNEKRTTPGAGRRTKRAAPTIDLKATEVPPVSAGGDPLASAPEPPHEAPVSEPVAATSAENAPPPNEPPSEPPSGAAPPGASDAQPDFISRLRGHLNTPVLAAGFAGALAMTLVLVVLWLTGLVPIRYAGSTATRARVAALEMEVHALQNRPATAADSKAQGGLAALAARVNAMQETIAKIPAGGASNDSALVDRVAAADNALKSLGVALTALTHRNDDIATNATQARERAEAAEKAVTELRSSVQIATTATAGLSSADFDALQKRIATLEQTTKAARDDIARTGASDAAARLALSAAALRDAVMIGAPFAPSLAQAKSLGADATLLTALEPFAAGGVPTSAALAQELRALLPAMIKSTETTAPNGGFLEKLQANAGNLVRVRPVGAPSGDDSAAVMARVESAAANADIGAALTDLGKLSDATRVPAQAWIAKANARQAALAAVRTLVTETARSLGAK